MTVKISLSNSSLDRFAQCPLSYFYSYLDPSRPNQEDVSDFYSNYGILCHFFAEMYPRTNFYMDMEWKQNKEKSEDNIDNILDSYGNLLMEQKITLDTGSMLAIYDELFPLINFLNEQKRDEYYAQGKDFIEGLPKRDWSKVIGLEKYFRIELDERLPPITGLIDMVERDDDGLIVTDYKTSKPYSENEIMKKIQLPLYGMACYLLYGEIPHTYRYDFVRFDKKIEVTIPIERLTEVKNIILFRYMQMMAYRAHGRFPSTYQDFYCKNFCGYSRLCSTYQAFNPTA
ncbi:RecB family exonuclease [Brevibacillus laterosporus]|uniref:RecB family exonuclease n=1 Tax=Brevibacillus laterosporus TaxID=1465 RepID=UPI003D1FEB25